MQVAERLGVKPQLIINWIREGRAHPTAVDAVGRLRFTNRDVDELRAGLGRRRGGGQTEGSSSTAGQ
ncbi:MAG: MerR family transcriptional regulator [Candidatus Dormibacteria bacterium]